MKDMHIIEREVSGRRYRIAAQSIWDSKQKRSVARQRVLGPADPPPVADLSETRTIGTQALGDVGALVWVAEQLDLVGHINKICGSSGVRKGPSIGEMVLAVAVQRACGAGPKSALPEFLAGCLPPVSCLKPDAFTGQAFHRLASGVSARDLEKVQLAIARTAVEKFELSTNVLAFDTTNFDTHIATTTECELAQRGNAKSKRHNLRVVGLGMLVSETGHVPLLHRAYPGNCSDHRVLEECLEGLGELHDALDQGEGRSKPAARTLVRDGGSWGEDLEENLDVTGYYTLVSLPLGHNAAKTALEHAAKPGKMQKLAGYPAGFRAARLRTRVGELDRTLVVLESPELLEGQKRGIEQALSKTRPELEKLQRQAERGRIKRSRLEERVARALKRDYLSAFVVTNIGGSETRPTLRWRVDSALRKQLEETRLGRRVLCTDQHRWHTSRIVRGFHGQWKVEELFRRAKGGNIVPWGPSHQWKDSSLRLHTFATAIGLMLVSLARLALRSETSIAEMMESLAAIRATMVRTTTGGRGRRPTHLLAPELTAEQRKAVKVFGLAKWFPAISSSRTRPRAKPGNSGTMRPRSRSPGRARPPDLRKSR
jgi:transposase